MSFNKKKFLKSVKDFNRKSKTPSVPTENTPAILKFLGPENVELMKKQQKKLVKKLRTTK